LEEAKSPEELKDIEDRVRERILLFQSIYPFLSDDILIDFVNLSQTFEENLPLVQELADQYEQDDQEDLEDEEMDSSS
jgi:hypothetical protein